VLTLTEKCRNRKDQEMRKEPPLTAPVSNAVKSCPPLVALREVDLNAGVQRGADKNWRTVKILTILIFASFFLAASSAFSFYDMALRSPNYSNPAKIEVSASQEIKAMPLPQISKDILAKEIFDNLPVSKKKRVQQWLKIDYGYSSSVDGIWGPATAKSLSLALTDFDSPADFISTALKKVPQESLKSFQPKFKTQTRDNIGGRPNENLVPNLILACRLTSVGSFGYGLADAQLIVLTGQGCAQFSPQPTFLPNMMPIFPQPTPQRLQTTCRWRSTPQPYRIPGLRYSPTLECN
jgi:hypothetical protein